MTLNLPHLTNLLSLISSEITSASWTEFSTLFKIQLRTQVKKNRDITSLGKYNNPYQKKDSEGGKKPNVF